MVRVLLRSNELRDFPINFLTNKNNMNTDNYKNNNNINNKEENNRYRYYVFIAILYVGFKCKYVCGNG